MKYQHYKLVMAKQIIKALSSSLFFWLVIGLLVIQAIWIAATGLYPMAFDEDFHFGIIKLYAHHISPFWNSQPEAANAFGAVYRDPSYLYHYLMSFPFRLISHFTTDQTVQVLWLRAINIGLFASGLVLFRKVLLASGASKALVHGCILAFILIPAVPLLAAQINYDNLLFALTAAVLWMTIAIVSHLKIHKTISIKLSLALAIILLLTSIVKYAFLPIALAIFIYLVIKIKQSYHSWREFKLSLDSDWKHAHKVQAGLLIAGLMLAVGLFSQRYVVNTALYHTPIPDCSKILDVEACSDYGPWIRDHGLQQTKSGATVNPIVFAGKWFHGMWLRLFFTVDGPSTQNQTRGPLLMPALTSIVALSFGLVLMVIYTPKLLHKYNFAVLYLFIAVSAGYVGVLWIDQYRAFLRTGQPVAINGRYLLPILLPLLLMVGLAYNEWLKDRTEVKLILAIVAIIGLSWGGGALTYILRSNNDWYWPNSHVRSVNQSIQRWLGPIVPGYYNQGQFLG